MITNVLALIYSIALIATIAAGIPQILQIIRTKNVEGISLQTYDMWFIFQMLAIPYMVQSGDMLWVWAGILWAGYYLTVIVLIHHYRYPRYIRAAIYRLVRILRAVPVHAAK